MIFITLVKKDPGENELNEVCCAANRAACVFGYRFLVTKTGLSGKKILRTSVLKRPELE